MKIWKSSLSSSDLPHVDLTASPTVKIDYGNTNFLRLIACCHGQVLGHLSGQDRVHKYQESIIYA